jgi:integrase
MEGQGSASEDGDGQLVTLATLLGTAELQRIHDAIAVLHGLGAEFFVEVPGAEVSLWAQGYDAEGNQVEELVEVLDQFADMRARITPGGITDALAASRNVFELRELHSDQPGMWRGSAARRHYHDVRLAHPIACNVSSLRVAEKWRTQLRSSPAPSTAAKAPEASDCAPILLSLARDSWLHDNSRRHGGSWTASTEANNGAAVSQFIDIVGDKLTTALTADDFAEYERVMRTLPKDWAKVRKSSGLDFAQLALQGGNKAKVSPKTLKDKGSSLGLFFRYLAPKGYWHGRYGGDLFSTVKQKRKDKIIRHTYSDGDLQLLFSGAGIQSFATAKFPVYVWGSLLLLYTGARSGEISQLRPSDVLQDAEGVWYIRITESEDEDGGLQTTKNEASVRQVPLHPVLIDLGFLNFCARAKSRRWLFPETFRHKQKVSKELGDWFNETLLVKAGLKADGVVLHGLRHTVINRFKLDANSTYLACAYTGHHTELRKAAANVVFDETYGNVYSMKLMASRLHPLLDYRIDWGEMKKILKDKGWA